jgi:hypothetical protein
MVGLASISLGHGSSAAPAPPPVRRRRRLDDIPASPKLEVRPAFDDELPELAGLLLELVPGLVAPFSSFQRVHHHSKSIYTVRNNSAINGCFACLHLSDEGLKKLIDGTLSMIEPQRACLAESGSRVDAVYAWAWAMRPPTNGIRAMGNLMACLRRPEFSKTEIYARPLTDKGFVFSQNLDSRRVECGGDDQGLWVSTRFE